MPDGNESGNGLKGALLSFGLAGGSAIVGAIQNKKNREFQEEQNQLNRQFAIDQANRENEWNLEQWNRTNAYNHPLEQMNRLRQAGLNPNLVYGKGAETTAQMVKSASYSAPNQEAVKIKYPDPQELVNQALIQQKIMAETDNVYKQAAIMDAQKTGIDLENIDKATRNTKNKLSLDIAQQTREAVINKINADSDNAGLQKELLNNKVILSEFATKKMYEQYELKVDQQNANIAKTNLENALIQLKTTGQGKSNHLLDQAIKNARNEGVVKYYDAQLAKYGITRGSEDWLRMMALSLGDDPDTLKYLQALQAGTGAMDMLKGFKGFNLLPQPKTNIPKQYEKFRPNVYDGGQFNRY